MTNVLDPDLYSEYGFRRPSNADLKVLLTKEEYPIMHIKFLYF